MVHVLGGLMVGLVWFMCWEGGLMVGLVWFMCWGGLMVGLVWFMCWGGGVNGGSGVVHVLRFYEWVGLCDNWHVNDLSGCPPPPPPPLHELWV